jgi:hypothetical protein
MNAMPRKRPPDEIFRVIFLCALLALSACSGETDAPETSALMDADALFDPGRLKDSATRSFVAIIEKEQDLLGNLANAKSTNPDFDMTLRIQSESSRREQATWPRSTKKYRGFENDAAIQPLALGARQPGVFR